jgi:RNA polymerase sigma-70 factor (ECF subfamily)
LLIFKVLSKNSNTNIEEKDLVKKLRNGDNEAFNMLYQKYADKVFYFSLRYLKNRQDAEGLTQEIFIKLWETRKKLDPELSLNSYLFTIARNTIFNKNRKKINEHTYIEYLKHHLDEIYDKTENDVLLEEVRSWIDKSVKKLPAQRQKIFKMSRYEGLSYKEISAKLNLSERTVEAHIRLALKSIRAVIDKNFMIVIPLLISLLNTLFFLLVFYLFSH